MMKVPVYDMQGKETGSITIDEESLGTRVNPALIKQAYVRYHANLRQGSARTKSLGMVTGSTRKLYRQKGTGNARVGASRTIIRKGGGVAFAKTKRRVDFHLDMPVKMRRRANRNALLSKLIDGEVRVLDKLEFTTPRTKDFIAFIDALKLDRAALVAINPDNDNARLSARNVPDVSVCPSHELTCFNMLNHRYLVISKEDLEAWLTGPSSKAGKGPKTASTGAAK